MMVTENRMKREFEMKGANVLLSFSFSWMTLRQLYLFDNRSMRMNKGENYTLSLPQQYKISFSYIEDAGKISNTPCKFSIFCMICSTFKLPTNHIRRLSLQYHITYHQEVPHLKIWNAKCITSNEV
jgi:hypothetical protein